MPPKPPTTGRLAVENFFEPYADGNSSTRKCKICGFEPTQAQKTGYGNLLKHLEIQNPQHIQPLTNFLATIADDGNRLKKQLQIEVPQRIRDYYEWIDWIVQDNLALSVCEKATYRKNSKLNDVCGKTLRKYMATLVDNVVDKIKADLPDKFGIVFDGWSDGTSTHFVAIFAAYVDKEGSPQYPLLAFQPLLDETNLSALSYEELIVSTLVNHLAPDARIVKNKSFEDALVKIQRGELDRLTDPEKLAMEPFVPDVLPVAPPVAAAAPAPGLNFAAVHAITKRQCRRPDRDYGDLSYIPATSNLVERFFSLAKNIQGTNRQCLLPSMLETIAFLKVNRWMWSQSTVVTAVYRADAEP